MSEPLIEPLPGIAVVGIAARFPGAWTAAELWQNVRDGVESVTFFDAAELAAAGVDPALLADERYVRAKAVLAGADAFDPAFFGFTPREAEWMDPQHRIFLECAWTALEDAGCDPRRQGGRVGVYAGSGTSSYLLANLLPRRELLETLGGLQAMLLNDRDFLAARASYKLGLTGPSAVVQTACSTSLVAIHMACQSLLAGECDLALAGGVSISVPLRTGYLYQEGGVLSPDGRCRAFDAAAAGAVEGNGCGVVVLKRLAEALADGDHVYAVVRGSAVNNDGAGRAGFTAPSVEGQAAVIAEALMMAEVAPDSVGYVEAHGSGTPLGDPIEVAALAQAFRAGTDRRGFCALGSVKTNIGHCNAAAGVAGFVKTVLALGAKTLPPSLHFQAPNPQIDFAASPFYVATAAATWPAGEEPRRAGVSSFGLGGTNAHVVLEEAPEPEPGDPPTRPVQLLVLSARSEAAVEAAAERLAAHLEGMGADSEGGAARAEAPSPHVGPDADFEDGEGRAEAPSPLAGEGRGEGALADTAWTLQVGRRELEHRRAVVVRGRADAVAALRDPRRAVAGRCDAGAGRPLVFLFPGLGDQYVGMARGLYAAEPVFREQIDLCAAGFARWLEGDLREVIFGAEAAEAATEPIAEPGAEGSRGPDLRAWLRRGRRAEDPAAARLERTLFAQPACFAIEVALGRLLLSWGLTPQAMIGYSVGEYAAACLAGALSLEDALALVAQRARLLEELPGGAMLAVPLPEPAVRLRLEELDGDGVQDGLSIAATNGPHLTVVAGPAEAVAELERRLAGEGVAAIRLRTTHAFHSAMMAPAAAAFAEICRQVAMRPPRIPYVSNVTGTWIAAADLADPEYWVRHLCGTVRFAEGVGELLAEPDRVFVEVGPGATLAALVKQHPAAAANRIAVPTLRRAEEERADVEHLAEAVGRLWVAGIAVDWAGFHGGDRRRRVPLPTYPFERRRCWVDPPPAGSRGVEAAAPAASGDLADWFWIPVWRQAPLVPAPVSERPEGSGPAGSGAEWLVFLDREGLGARIAERLRREGREVATVAAAGGFRAAGGDFGIDPSRREDYDALFHHLRDAGGRLPSKILHLWGVTAGEPSFAEAQTAGLLSLTFLAQALMSTAGGEPVRIAVVANGLGEVVDGDPVHPGKATVLGAVKVLHQEAAGLVCGSVDVALPPAGSAAEERLVAGLLAELAAPAESVEPAVALRGRQRFVRAFEPAPLAADLPSRLVPGGAYLIADAAHGPGLAMAEALALSLAARVALVLPPEEDGAAARLAALETKLAAAGGDGRLLVLRAAPGDPAGLGAALAAARGAWGPLQGVVYTGGAFTGGLVQLKTAAALQAALDPVVQGAEALLAAAAAEPQPPDFVLLSSSTPAVTGGLGQLDIAAAGAFLDALALRGAGGGGPFTVAAHWDPYQWDGWLVAGAAGAIGGMAGLAAGQVEENLAAFAVPAVESAEALRRLLAAPLPRVVVSARDLRGLIAETDSATAEALLAQMSPARGEKAGRPGLSTAYAPPGDELEAALADLWQDLFGIAPIGVDDSFLELGGHSLLAIQMVTRIRELFAAELPVTALFEAPTVAALAKAVRRARGEEDPAELEALLALVEDLSPEEAARRLAELGLAG